LHENFACLLYKVVSLRLLLFFDFVFFSFYSMTFNFSLDKLSRISKFRVMKSGIKSFFTYSTTRSATIKSSRVGVVYRIVQFIVIYYIGYVYYVYGVYFNIFKKSTGRPRITYLVLP
jgi:hypothetical protein